MKHWMDDAAELAWYISTIVEIKRGYQTLVLLICTNQSENPKRYSQKHPVFSSDNPILSISETHKHGGLQVRLRLLYHFLHSLHSHIFEYCSLDSIE